MASEEQERFRKKQDSQWEYIGPSKSRLKIPGGWLVSTDLYSGCHLLFVEDKDHIWKLVEV
jgi:hypothetical protein